MMTDIKAVEHAFGAGNDMFGASEPEPVENTERFEVDIHLWSDEEITETGVLYAYVAGQFLNVVFPDGQSFHWNVAEVKSYAVTPL